MQKRLILLLVLAAAALALYPMPAAVVERYYSNGAYPFVQWATTSFSNRTSYALLDVLIAVVVIGWMGLLVADVRSRRTERRRRFVRRAVLRAVALGAILYIGFVAIWGLHYRRVPLRVTLRLDGAKVTPLAQVELATAAVDALNHLAETRPEPEVPLVGSTIDLSLRRAFEDAQRQLGISWLAEPGRPKRSLLVNWYLRRAGVDGVTNPYLLETVIVADALPIEQPMIIAHEWAHLAGFADEGDASFVGWLTCLNGSLAAQYSGWLFLYSESMRGLPAADRDRIAAGLGPRPRADLLAIRERLTRSLVPLIATAGWRAYDGYLKMNRIERGTDSYTDVVRLVVGTRLGATSIERAGHAAAKRKQGG